jgi:hypothetical protein
LGVKLPLGTLALVALGGCAAAPDARRRERLPAVVAVWLPAVAIVALVSSQTGFNHHVRYVLPAIPFLCVGAGVATRCVRRPGRAGRVTAGLAVAAAVWAGVAGVSVGPHFLSDFNEAAGGPERGHEHLTDSNIDWGQDLLRLKRWLDEHPDHAPLRLAYYNTLDAGLVGIRYELPPTDPRPGRYAVSAHFVVGGSFPVFDGRGGVSWVRPREYSYFRHFRPIARAGYSIFLYDVSPAEAERVRALLGLPPLGRAESPGA